MIELRWLRGADTTTKPDRLQFRYQQPYLSMLGTIEAGSWTEWKEVPVKVEGDENGRG